MLDLVFQTINYQLMFSESIVRGERSKKMKLLFGSRIYLFLKTLKVKGDMQIIYLQDYPLRTNPEAMTG